MSEEGLMTYRGNCHCGKFVYEAKLPEIKSFLECNCSICHKKGYAWVFPKGQLDIVKGSIDDLTAYVFNKGSYKHRFCPHCGTALMAFNTENPPGMTTGLNARALQGLDVWSLEAKPFDAKARPPPYTPPVYNGPEPSAEVENGKTYNGSCHCGAVTVAVKVKPLETWDISVDGESIVECNCSICARGGYIWIYPHKNQSVIEGRDNLSYRVFNNNIARKAFCKHCGVHILNEANPLSDEDVSGLSDTAKAWRGRMIDKRCITLRILNDFDCKMLKTMKLDGWNMDQSPYIDP